MTFNDIFRKSFLQAVNTGDVSMKGVLFTFLITCVLAAYLFVVYRIVTRKTFYNKNFNIALVAIAVIIAAIIMTIQSNIVISLGMVGALSIVRFRTAIKDPMDLVFLFWAIAIGITCGADLEGIGIIMSLALTVGVFVLDAIPSSKAPVLLIVNADDKSVRDKIVEAVKENCGVYHIKSQTMERERLDMIIEVRPSDGSRLIDDVNAIDGIVRCSLVSHDGEVTF